MTLTFVNHCVTFDVEYLLGSGLRMIKWSRDRWRHVTIKLATPIRLVRNILKTPGDAMQQSLITIPSLLWGSTVGYPSDSLASCCFVWTVVTVIKRSYSNNSFT